ncbi:glycoside hydrolase family 36 protein [Leifsonia sp. LS-T14]|uniref:glycoside hydrolase family 36 protein n=1 Tax=unclassified Leifsonia TaxID=2663824 RepID=UPI0035A69F13
MDVELECSTGTPKGSVRVHTSEHSSGRIQLHVTVDGFGPAHHLKLRWSVPCTDATALWTSRVEGERWLPVSFSEEYVVSAISGSPVAALYGADGANRLTSALSETLRPVALKFGISGRSAELVGQARIALREEREYAVSLMLDTRLRPVTETLDSVATWWAEAGDTPLTAPASGASPMYSTWYSLGQNVDRHSVESEAALAKEAGCTAVIVDDGWQTADAVGGYSSCGDWIPDPEKFGDMAKHVARVHRLGMKYLLWFALPFVGEQSEIYRRFADRTLGYRADLDTWVLDPRHPEVREYLIGTVVRAVRDWQLDGIKIDFIDAFALHGITEAPIGTDFVHVEDAVDELLARLTAAVTALNTEILIEFRQTYVGPRLRRYCNLLRVTDCAMDATENRVHSLDLRLLAERTLIHSDMIMWHPEAPPAAAGRQLLSVLFAVPQISVRLDQLDAVHFQTLKFWLQLFATFRDTLLHGSLTLSAPDLSYPEARADGAAGSVLATFHSNFLEVQGELSHQTLLINGSSSDQLVLHGEGARGEFHAEVFDAAGTPSGTPTLSIRQDPFALTVPSCGVAILRRQTAGIASD